MPGKGISADSKNVDSYGPNIVENSVIWDADNSVINTGWMLYNDGDTHDYTYKSNTFGDNRKNGSSSGYQGGGTGNDADWQHNLILDNWGSGIREGNTAGTHNNNAWNNCINIGTYQCANYGSLGTDPGISQDPKIAYLPDASRTTDGNPPPVDSGGKGDGQLIGAQIINKYHDGQETSEPLWPFPNEQWIKEDMCDPTLSRENTDPTRGFCASGNGLYGGPITLTSYIWEYLGNPCPADICDYGPVVCGDGSCNGGETCNTCSQDCGQCCGNNICESQYGEDVNTCPADCPVTPTYFGDLNHDGKISISDIMIIMRHILNRETNWDSDVDEDGEVNIFDLVKVARIWGKQYETDTTAPTVVSSMPSQSILPLGTSTAIVGVETDERAVCRYNPTPTNFASMTAFDRTGGIQHTTEATGLQDDQNYLYYVQCQDEAGNLNSTDYLINFSVGSYGNGGPPPPTPYCGDNNCDANETCSSCEADCGVCAPPSSGLVASYSFNEGTGTILTDSSGNSNHGTINGATWTTGKYSGGLDFDGIDDFVSIPNSASLDITGNQLTLEAWIYPYDNGSVNGRRIISKRTDAGGSDVYSLHLALTGKISFRIDEVSLKSTNTFSPNTWVHVVGVYNGSSKRIYLNGTLDPAYGGKKDNIDSSTKGVFIGHREAEDRWFKGIIDELRIYNRSLTQAEILNDMNNPVS
jgi:hypothetical protein